MIFDYLSHQLQKAQYEIIEGFYLGVLMELSEKEKSIPLNRARTVLNT